MSHAMAAPDAGSPGPAGPAAYRRAGAALAAEWIKLRSLRSMLLTPLLGAVACSWLAIGETRSNGAGWAHLDPVQKAQFDPLVTNFNFEVLGTILFGVLGALVATNEYGSGLIRTTLAATPQRGLVLSAKAVLADRITPDAVTRHAVPYLPSNLGDEMLHHHAGLSPGPAVAGLAAWVLVLAAAAAFSLRGRDA